MQNKFGGVIKRITGLKKLLRLVVSEQFSVKWIHLLDILMKSSYFTSVLTGNVFFFFNPFHDGDSVCCGSVSWMPDIS